MESILNYIGGEFIEAASGTWLDNVEPATGQVDSQVADSGDEDVDRAVQAASHAFPSWSATPVGQRSRLLLAVANQVERECEAFARAESIDSGKPLTRASELEIPRAVANFRFFAAAIVAFSSESHATDNQAINYTLRRPRGVTGLISPWNLPLYLLSWKVAPALAAGCTAVAKPSELTPRTATLLARACQRAGLPPGVLNILHGRGATAGAGLVAHPGVGTISFTGGTETGRAISRTAGPMFKKLALEMGGKNPTLVFADADIDEAVQVSLRAAFANQGQICLCGSRIYVERTVYTSFLDRFVTQAKSLAVGDPLEAATQQGALVSADHRDKVLSYIELARKEGGSIACGGRAPDPSELPERCRGGFFVEPTVIVDLPSGCRIDREEIFGPVVSIAPFDSEREAVDLANDTPYGLAASVWTRDLSRAHRVANLIEAGTVWINCWMLRDLRVPFGGTKASGVGREGGNEALRFFTEPKNVCVHYASTLPR